MRERTLAGMAALALSVAVIAPAQAAVPVRLHQERPVRFEVVIPEKHQPGETTADGREYDPDRILVSPRAGAGPKPLARVNAATGGRVRQVLPGTTWREVRLPQGLSVAQAVRRYEASDDVASAEPDYSIEQADVQPVTPNDPGFGHLYGLDNMGQTAGVADADIDAPEAWATTTGNAQTLVAVIDTGVDVFHPDLRDNVWSNPGEIAGNGIDDDNNGYVDDVHGWDFYSNDNSVFDNAADDAHGTHVAGIIAATGNNGVGVTGVAWRASMMPLKVLGEGGKGYVSDAIRALDYAVANGSRISNNSWGGVPYSQALRDAIRRAQAKGHLFVAAAGNGGSDGIGDDLDLTPEYPASYPEENVLTVAATDHADLLAPFSNYGSMHVDLAAPGVKIAATTPGNTYSYMSGTSMAAPHVAGAAALLLSLDPTLAASQLKAELMSSVDLKRALGAKAVTGGRLNVDSAVTRLTTQAPPESVEADVTLTANRTVVRFGQVVSFAGTLKTDEKPVSGQNVVLQQRLVGHRGWREAGAGAAETTTDGTFTISGLRPLRNADYRVRFDGDESRNLSPAHTAARRVNVRVRLTLRTATKSLSVRDAQRVFGRVSPRSHGNVQVVFMRHGRVIDRSQVRPNQKQYTRTYRPTRPGRYVVRVIRPGDQRNLGASTAKWFRVTRG